MRHPGTETIVRHLDGGLRPRTRRRVESHLSSCAQCQDVVDWMRATRVTAAQLTALAVPAAAWSRIEPRLERGDAVLLPTERPTHGRRRAAAIAASLILCASMAAALVPETGVRAWLARQLGVTSATPETPPPAAPAMASMAVSPVDGAVHVALTAPTAPLQLRLRIGSGPDLDVSATGGAAAARFIVGAGRIEIAGAARGEIVLVLPRNARLITIDVEGVRAVEARGAALTVLAPRADTIGTELILPVR